MLPYAPPNARHVLFDNGNRKVRHDVVEMHMLEQLEPGITQDMYVLQILHSLPIAAPNQLRQWCSRDCDQNRFLPGKEPAHDAVLGFIGDPPRAKTRSIYPFSIAGIDNHQSGYMTARASAERISRCACATSALAG